MVPYLRDVMPRLLATKALTDPGTFRDGMREITFSMVASFPMDILKMMALFLDVDEKWLEEQFYPEEMIEAFGVITRVNRLDDLMRLGLSLGMISLGDLGWLRGISEE